MTEDNLACMLVLLPLHDFFKMGVGCVQVTHPSALRRRRRRTGR